MFATFSPLWRGIGDRFRAPLPFGDVWNILASYCYIRQWNWKLDIIHLPLIRGIYRLGLLISESIWLLIGQSKYCSSAPPLLFHRNQIPRV